MSEMMIPVRELAGLRLAIVQVVIENIVGLSVSTNAKDWDIVQLCTKLEGFVVREPVSGDLGEPLLP